MFIQLGVDPIDSFFYPEIQIRSKQVEFFEASRAFSDGMMISKHSNIGTKSLETL